MRLWHYKLLPILPDKMLIAEWRECLAIKRQWEKGTLKDGFENGFKYTDISYTSAAYWIYEPKDKKNE